jgi:hypothetical protein
MENLIDIGSKVIAFGTLLIGTWWGVVKFLKRDEHFPRVEFEVAANFIGSQDGKLVLEVLAKIENKGFVPLRIKDLNFKVRGLSDGDPIVEGDKSIRGQIRIPQILWEGSWIPEHWEYTFIYPSVKTEYNYVAAIPQNISILRVEGSFSYDREGNSHHAAKLQKVPKN